MEDVERFGGFLRDDVCSYRRRWWHLGDGGIARSEGFAGSEGFAEYDGLAWSWR